MGKAVTYGAIFVGGVVVGLLLADQYAKQRGADAIHSGLSSVGLGGGVVETIADRLVTPSL